MKTKIQKCDRCEEETVQDVGKKQSKEKIKRKTVRCRKCGTRIIDNKKMGKRVIPGNNIYRIGKEEEKR